MKRLLHSRKGFSRLELVIALLVIVLLIALLTPRYLRYVRACTEEVCCINRATILRLYQAHKLLDPDCTLEGVLEGACPNFEDGTRKFVCPGGGKYYADDENRIICSQHG